ncbi:MAG: HDIG domain-containing protein [Fuerstiella sp.]
MSFFGARRARQTRVFRPSPSVWEKLSTSLQDYRVLTLVLVALFAIVMLLLAAQGWRSRFPYREGQVSASGVQGRVDFRIENVLATRQARVDAEANARLVFVQDSSLIGSLAARFRTELTAIANAESLEQLPAEVVDGFALGTEIPGDVEKGTAPTTRFARVRLAMTDSSMAIGDRIDQMVMEFSTLLRGIQLVGILDEEARSKVTALADIEPQKPIEIVDSTGAVISYNLMTDITLADQLRETGRLGGAWVSLSNLQQIRPSVETWLRNRLKGQLSFDANRTAERIREAVEKVEPQYDVFAAGRVLVPAGTLIGKDQLQVLTEEHQAHDARVSFSQRLLSLTGTAVLVTVMVVLFGLYIARNQKHLLDEIGQLVALVVICSSSVTLSGILSRDPWRAEIMPLLAAVMIIAIVHDQVLAVLAAFCLSLLITISTTGAISHFAVLMFLSFIVVIPLRNISSRSVLIKVGFLLAIVGFVSVWGMSLLQSHDFSESWSSPAMLLVGLKLAFWTLVCCFIVHGSLPFIESAFGIVTDISLLELTDVSHPLLQELARRAPGTYNHSITVATIGEAAADAIGANGLLLRVGAYFHDIGKMVKPQYFIENMAAGQENPHDKLAPAMSALIIIGHVKDGSEMADQHNLPRKLIDFIEQHHGTTLVEYFFREAASRADEDHRTDADESTFRYPGPRPQSKETGVMMLADAIESASRTLSEPTPKRIQSLVKEITLKRVLDGQFDECGLTMSELRIVQESLVKSLLAVHHGRVKYPDQKTA